MTSNVARGRKLAARARMRLALREAAGGAAIGAFAGAIVGVVAAVVARLADAGSLPVALWLPLVGAAVGASLALRRTPDVAHAALALDRAGETGESLVSALTAVEAPDELRELAAERAVERLSAQPVRRWLPVHAPRFAAPAAACVALLAAVALLSSPDARSSSAAERADDLAAAAGAGETAAPAPGGTDAALPVPGGPAATALPEFPTAPDGAPVSDDDLRRLAQDLAGRGSTEAARALALLATGDRDAAEQLLRETLIASAGDGGEPDAGPGTGPGTETGTASGTSAGSTAPVSTRDRWSGARWPLRYDRAVRAAFAASPRDDATNAAETDRDNDRDNDTESSEDTVDDPGERR